MLDLAEKLWSQDFRRATWRSERETAIGESIDVVLGYDAVMALLAGDDAAPERPDPLSWELRDKSATGLGASLPIEAGEHIPLGALIVDIVLKPAWTPLLAKAAARGLATHAGVHMLAGQLEAVMAFFELPTGRSS